MADWLTPNAVEKQKKDGGIEVFVRKTDNSIITVAMNVFQSFYPTVDLQ